MTRLLRGCSLRRLRWLASVGFSLFAAASLAGRVRAGEIGWIENYALASDRSVPLKQLIPGTEDYYYYHCLDEQTNEHFDKADVLLKEYVARYNWTPRAIEIENRQALLTYDKNPQRALSLIRQRLNLQFNQQREVLNQKSNLPTTLDPKLLDRAHVKALAFSHFPNTIQGFEEPALDWLVAENLSVEQRRQLLQRLQRPDYPNLVQLIVDDLNAPNSGGFGQFEIHRRLLLAQLNELLKLKPNLLNNPNFVMAYVAKLRPSDDVNWQQEPGAKRAYFNRLWGFVKTLPPAQNSLKAQVLYQILLFDRSQGKYDLDLFLEYLKLPKQVVYVSPKYMEPLERRQFAASLQQDFSPFTGLPPVGDDEPLVRSYLQHFLVEADNYNQFAPYVSEPYLKQQFAEAKIVNGVGDAEKLYALLPPEVFKALKERIDIDFAYTNETELTPAAPVSLDLFVKNVDTLIVKVFQLNAENFYRANLREIGPDMTLDGLVANSEKTYTYDSPPLRRVKRHFEFPQLKGRGIYVIDFIGNGKASRAVIRKGKLQFIQRTTLAGQLFHVFDEKHEPVLAATLWLAGTSYKAQKDGSILIPFSNQPGVQHAVLSADGVATLIQFQQQAEEYRLDAPMYVDREELLSRRTAQLIVRPQLLVNGTPISLKVLEEVRLKITSTDLDNVTTVKEVADFKLASDRETVYEFLVPQRLASIQFTLQAKVQNASRNQKVELKVQQDFTLNEIDRTDKTEDLHFEHIDSGYVIDLLGKTGEAKADRSVHLQLKLRDLVPPVETNLQTDAAGRITLGPLPGVATVTATDALGTAHTWAIRSDEHTYPSTIQGEANKPLQIPYMGTAAKPERSELSLLELRGAQFVADRFESLSIKDSFIVLDKLPPGDYSLWIKPSNIHLHIRLTTGAQAEHYLLGDYRKLEVRNPHPLQMRPVEVTEKAVKIQLENDSPLARVQVFAVRFEPDYPAYGILSEVLVPEPYSATSRLPESQFVVGRNIGDEYRYILDRKFARKYPGNMLERPSLLLNPWAIRSTQTELQLAQQGEAFQGPPPRSDVFAKQKSGAGAVARRYGSFADLDFLAHSSLVVANLAPDKDGVIELKRSELGAYQQVVFVAVDLQNTVSRIVALPEQKPQYLDLRLDKGLDPQQHYTQQQQVSILNAKDTLTIADITSAHFEAFDTVGKVYSLYAALNPDPKLADFSFVRDWPNLKPDEKKELYFKYASHEFHLFVYHKDPEFFKRVIRPYLANKKEKKFLDHWFLEEDLREFLKPWNYAQLNTLERILLAQRIEGEGAIALRRISDQVELLPPDPERLNHLFQTALKGSALEARDELGLRRNLETAAVPKPLALPESETPAASGGAAPAPAEKSAADKAGDEKLGARLESKREAGKKAVFRGAEKGEKAADDEMERLDDMEKDIKELKRPQQYYRQLDKTMEWVESNYYQLPLEKADANLITANRFWQDYAAHGPKPAFYTQNLAEASHNFPEMLSALSLVDLPFAAGKHQTAFHGTQLVLTAASPMIVYREEIQPAGKVAEHAPILVSENFFRQGDRFRQVNGEQVDKFVNEEFLIDTVYGCQIVVTNPASSKKRVEVLLQIPAGALALQNVQTTKSVHLDLEPYHTQTLEYFFYFPAIGRFPHYPVQVAAHNEILAFAKPFLFNVVKELSQVDKESWDYISQHGSSEDALNFLKHQNLLRVNLDRLAWRMHDKKFFESAIGILTARHIYNNSLWSFGVVHNDPAVIRQFLQFANSFVDQCGLWLDSPLLVIDPIERKNYEQMDYKPLVNARVGKLGRERMILNNRFFAQYEHLLRIFSYRTKLSNDELMGLTYYLLLQDRVEEGLEFFNRVNRDQLAVKLQYDYFAAYLDFSKGEPQAARKIAAQYAEYPVKRWQMLFANLVNQADEIDHREAKVVDKLDRTQVQNQEAAATPAFDFTVDSKKVKVDFQNLAEIQVNYYLMDIELLFSRNPFVQGESKQFSYIQPNESQTLKLPVKGNHFEFDLPAKLANSNVLVEITAGGVTKSQAYYANALKVQVVENYGQLRVSQDKEATPLPKVYCKVYARMQDGSVKFYKDGYTDLRGLFDYSSLSTNELDFVQRFSILVLSEEHGAVVREAAPPKR
ncbi:MAG TPA: hypothetical protein VFE24_00535 [Pirellulales bacterium]|jgi:hypothetical protein|nr:hypothetical protein [Pirellulales bacterium]